MATSTNNGWPIPNEISDPWYTAFVALVNAIDSSVYRNDADHRWLSLTWAASIGTIDAAVAGWWSVNAITNIAPVLAAPANPISGQYFHFSLFNTLGGALTSPMTFNASYRQSGFVSPANGFNTSTTFRCAGTTWWQVTPWSMVLS